MQTFEGMGDSRHKKSPPTEQEEDVTESFRAAVTKALDLNAKQNKLREKKKGDPGYLISSHADLADAIGTSKRMVTRILGGVRETTKIKLVDRSVFVGRIREKLNLPSVTQVVVRSSRAAAVRQLDELSDDEFAVYAAELASRSKR